MIHFNDAQGNNYIAGVAADNGNLLIFKLPSDLRGTYEVEDVTDAIGKDVAGRWYKIAD